MECNAMASAGESQLIPLVVDMHGPRLANKNEQECHVTRDNDDEHGFCYWHFYKHERLKDDLLSWRK